MRNNLKSFIVGFLIVPAIAFAGNSTDRQKQIAFNPGQFFQRNFVLNPDAELNTSNVTVSGATVTRNTTTPIEGKADFSVSLGNNATDTVTWTLGTLDNSLKGQNCELDFYYTASSIGSAVKFEVVQGSNVVIRSDLLAVNSNPQLVKVNVPCGDLSGATTVRIANQTGNSGTSALNVDKVLYGAATNISYLQSPFEIDSGTATVSYDGNYTVVKFTSSDTFRVSQPITADILTVGGGGGGSGGASGNALAGGGAGGVLYTTGKFVGAGTYSVTVGAGGAGSTGAGGGNGQTGGNSDISGISGITAYGGGGGGGSSTGSSGGSGGGGSFNSHLAAGGSGTGGQGTSGGASYSSGGIGGGGGGGGCASSGGGATGSGGGNGGAGCANSITGSSVTYGGGGGGAGTSGGSGGSGGGGNANQAGTNGLGGGGGGGSGFNSGFKRGNGVVILRFLTPPNYGHIYRPELQAISWSGYHGSISGGCASTSATFADPTACTGITLNQLTNRNFGTVTTASGSLPGITFTPVKTGMVYVCATPYQSGSGAAQNWASRLVDGSGTIINPGVGGSINLAAGKNFSLPVCGIYNVTDLTSKTIKLQMAISGGSSTNYSASPQDGGANITWSIFALDQNIPAPVLVGSVTSGSTGAERIERVRFGGASERSNCTSSPCTIYSQSGSWVSSVTRNSTGNYTVNIASGVFTSEPTCTGVAKSISLQNTALIPVDATGSVTSKRFDVMRLGSAGTNDDAYVEYICTGPR